MLFPLLKCPRLRSTTRKPKISIKYSKHGSSPNIYPTLTKKVHFKSKIHLFLTIGRVLLQLFKGYIFCFLGVTIGQYVFELFEEKVLCETF